MPQRQLNVRSDEAATRASALGKRLGESMTEVVVEALRHYEAATEPRDAGGLTAEQRKESDDVGAFVRSLQAFKVPGATSDHRDMYDENGLPR